MISMRTVAVAVLLLTLGACATAPPRVADVPPGSRPASDTDEAGLWQLMERDEYLLRTSEEVIRDPDLQHYLEGVLCRVVPDHCADIRLYVVPSSMLDAYMQPNGAMVLFTGLLLRVENEAQLAAIMGHEVAHYTKRHGMQRYRAWRREKGALQTVSSILSAGVGVASANANKSSDVKAAGGGPSLGQSIGNAAQAAGDVIDSAIDSAVDAAERRERARKTIAGSTVLAGQTFFAITGQLVYSRAHEAESDELGIAWMNKAGYDPASFASVWRVMEAEEVLAKRAGLPTFLRRHPPAGDRKDRTVAWSTELATDAVGDLELHAEAYRSQIAPFRHAWLANARQGLGPELEKALLDRQREIGVPAGLVSYHEADMHRKRNPGGDLERSLSLFRDAVGAEGCPPAAFREYGLALWDAGRNDEAADAFESYLANDPDAVDHAMIRSYIKELTE